MSLEDRQRSLDPNDPNKAAFMLAIRRAGAHATTRRSRPGNGRGTRAMRANPMCMRPRPLPAARRPLCHRGSLAVANGSRRAEAVTAAFHACPTS
jgi:hypothetical protein